MSFVGDLNINTVVNKKFTTVDADDVPTGFTGAPIIAVYKDNSTSKTLTGITVSTNFDSITGLHNVQIDFSQDGSFYSAGSDFDVVILAGTVSTVSRAGYNIFGFSISHRNRDANLTQIDSQATSGNNATLHLKKLNIINNSGDAMILQSTGGHGTGLSIEGYGDGEALSIIGGTGGTAIYIDSENNNGIEIFAINGRGMDIQGGEYGIAVFGVDDTGIGVISEGGSNGYSIDAPTHIRGNLIGTVSSLLAAERNSLADAFLNRDMSLGTDSGTATVRTVRQALRFLRNKWTLVSETLSVKKEDDSTESWAATVGTTTATGGITSVDPASS